MSVYSEYIQQLKNDGKLPHEHIKIDQVNRIANVEKMRSFNLNSNKSIESNA